MTKETENNDIKEMSFEQSLKELEEIVRSLEEGGGELDKSIESYTRGTALQKNCEKRLAEAKLKVEKIIANDGGKVELEEVETE